MKTHIIPMKRRCKICLRACKTPIQLKAHIRLEHFEMMHCEIPNCGFETRTRFDYTEHLIDMHENSERKIVDELLEKIAKLQPDMEMLKYV